MIQKFHLIRFLIIIKNNNKMMNKKNYIQYLWMMRNMNSKNN